MKNKPKIGVAFFASSTYGSELKSGFELLGVAARHGFDVAIISDIEKNDSSLLLSNSLDGITIYVVPSVIKQHKLLHRYTDFIPQILWHYRVAKLINEKLPDREAVWIINGAQPWLPLKPYIKEGVRVIWGPIGGDEGCPKVVFTTLPFMAKVRELLRNLIQKIAIKQKAKLFLQQPANDIIPMARTKVAGTQLQNAINNRLIIPTIPERLYPLKATKISVSKHKTPKFIWVGQNIARKNLQMALDIFTQIQANYFPNATLDIYGVTDPDYVPPSIRYHGWVCSIDWAKYSGSGVLLITSYREGMPSVLIEAIENGLFCISTNVGSIGEIECPTLTTLSMDKYPNVPKDTIKQLYQKISLFLEATEIVIPNTEFEKKLHCFLREVGVTKSPLSSTNDMAL